MTPPPEGGACARTYTGPFDYNSPVTRGKSFVGAFAPPPPSRGTVQGRGLSTGAYICLISGQKNPRDRPQKEKHSSCAPGASFDLLVFGRDCVGTRAPCRPRRNAARDRRCATATEPQRPHNRIPSVTAVTGTSSSTGTPSARAPGFVVIRWVPDGAAPIGAAVGQPTSVVGLWADKRQL